LTDAALFVNPLDFVSPSAARNALTK